MASSRLIVNATWVSPTGESTDQIMTIRPLTMLYHQIAFDGNVIEIDIINNRNTLKSILTNIVTKHLLKRMHNNGKLNDQYVVLSMESVDTRVLVFQSEISLVSYNISIVDVNNETDVYRALVGRMTRFLEMCSTVFVK